MSEYSTAILSDVPVAYYRCDDGSGTVATDESGNQYTGTYSGVTSYNQTGAIIDDVDTSLLFSAIGTLLFSPNVNPTSWTLYTLELWIKISGGFQYVVITYDGTTVREYLNGSPYGTGSGPDVILLDQGLTWIGTNASATIDEVALYNSVFSDAQVAWHYTIGTTGRKGVYMLPTTYRRDGQFAATYRRGL
jgi:hypothetical protein